MIPDPGDHWASIPLGIRMPIRRFHPRAAVVSLILAAGAVTTASSQATRLLRQPSVSATQVAFTYGGDLWIANRDGGEARRLTSTPAVERDPQFSPDGKWIAFTSNRSGNNDVYVIPTEGGIPAG